jgi:hypothetical protein
MGERYKSDREAGLRRIVDGQDRLLIAYRTNTRPPARVLDTLPRLRDRLAMLDEEARPTILTFHGETGSRPIECEEWTCDIGAPGWAVRGYLDPEYEDPPPMCPAPTPEAP